MSHCIPFILLMLILKINIIIHPISNQMIKLQAAIKYGEEDFSGAKGNICLSDFNLFTLMSF